MRRWDTKQVLNVGLLVSAALISGCDSESFAPPAGKTRGSASPTGAMPVRAKEIVLVLPAEENLDLSLYDLVGRNESGLLKVVYRSVKPSPTSSQSDLIKEAVSGGASALVVVPDAKKETADALAALDPKKTPVVLLGRSPTGSRPASATHIAFQAFDASAEKLADAIIEAGKTMGFKPDSPALFVSVAPADETSTARDAALAAALKDAKIPVAATVSVTGDSPALEKPLIEALKGRPEVRVLVGDDEAAISAANAVRKEFPNRKFLVAGYSAGRNTLTSMMTGQVAALAERNVEALVRRAFRLAFDRAEGKDVPAEVTIDIPIRPGNVTAGGPDPHTGGTEAKKAAEAALKGAAPEAKKEK